MTRKAGQIIPQGERGDRWMVRVYRGEDPNGKRVYHSKSIQGTKKDAQRYLTSVMRNVDLGTFVEPSAMTVNQYLDKWLESSARPRLRPRTFLDYQTRLQRYIREPLGYRRLSQITPLEIQAVYNGMQERGLSARTVRYAHAILTSALKQAVKWRLLTQNPADFVDLPRQQRKEMHALSAEEARRFLAETEKSRWGVLFAFALTTGMRPEEYLALQWRDLDWQAGAATVRRVLVRMKGGWHFAEPKTAKSRRTVPLPPSVLRALNVHKKLQAEERLAHGPGYADEDLVFAGLTGKPADQHNLISRHFKPALQAVGLPDTFRLYDLRHSCATLLLAQGENPKIVSERLGHASVVLTLDTYSHVLPHMQEGAVSKLEAALFAAEG